MNGDAIEFLVVVAGALVIVDVVYELCRVWIRHAEQRDANLRADQRRRRSEARQR